MDCATIRSDVIGDFQEPYRAVLVDGDDIAALPSKRLRNIGHFYLSEL
jgi:hypothetical protein